MRRVVVTGLGAVTPLGVGVRRSWARLINGQVGVASLDEREPKFDSIPSRVAGLVPKGSRDQGGWDPRDWVSSTDEHRMALFTQYAVAAAEEAMQDAGCHPRNDEEREEMGVCIGSGIGNFQDVYDTSVAFDKDGYKKVSPLFVPRLLINLAAGHVAMKYGLQGPNTSPTTACTTGAHALGDAARLIAHGSAPVMLAGASESCIHPLALGGFARARSLATDSNASPHLASRPFDKSRSGFVVGEGAGVVVLEERERARRRGARIYAELVGYGLSCDALHMTAPAEDGGGAALAMARALRDAEIEPADVDYVNAHATSTALGDAAEHKAVQDVLLGRGRWDGAFRAVKSQPSEINVSSSKGAMGHLLGAAGAVEAIFTILALTERILPPTANLHDVGDVQGSESGRQMASADGGDTWGCNYVPLEAQDCRTATVALTNSFGFGGTNASLCFSRRDLEGK